MLVTERRVLRPSEVAKILGVSSRTVGRLIEQGALAHVRVARRALGILAEDLEQYLDERRTIGRG